MFTGVAPRPSLAQQGRARMRMMVLVTNCKVRHHQIEFNVANKFIINNLGVRGKGF